MNSLVDPYNRKLRWKSARNR